MRILIMSDTHLGQTSSKLPEEIFSEISKSDAIIHAGDIGSTDLVDTLSQLDNFFAVFGNMDSYEMTTRLPEFQRFTINGLNFGLAHGFGHPHNLPEKIISKFFPDRQLDYLIYGHSHIPKISKSGNITCINPGSLSMNRSENSISYAIMTITDNLPQISILRLNR